MCFHYILLLIATRPAFVYVNNSYETDVVSSMKITKLASKQWHILNCCVLRLGLHLLVVFPHLRVTLWISRSWEESSSSV